MSIFCLRLSTISPIILLVLYVVVLVHPACMYSFSARRNAFTKRRKLHYNEFYAVKMARQLLENEEGDDEELGEKKPSEAASVADESDDEAVPSEPDRPDNDD